MKFEIKEETIRCAKQCSKGYSCLNEDRQDLCKVEFCLNGKVHFIKCLSEELCPYQHSFGNQLFCSCPVRQEIYNRYKV